MAICTLQSLGLKQTRLELQRRMMDMTACREG